MNLYEISKEYLAALNSCEFDEETGEVLTTPLAEISANFTEKAVNVGLFIKNIMADADAIRSEEKKLAMRRKTLENKADGFKKYLLNGMKALDCKLISESRISLKVTTSSQLQVSPDFVEWAELHAKYLLTYAPPSADKMAIKRELKAGTVFAGVENVEHKNILIK